MFCERVYFSWLIRRSISHSNCILKCYVKLISLGMEKNTLEASYKKTISYDFRGYALRFKVSQMVFGSQQVDSGTHHLLRSLESQEINNYSKVLDFGSGYGPIGICLKKYLPSSEVHMVDRDALALDYCRANEKLNDIDDLKIYGSLGLDDVVDRDFDLIVSNIPAKIGDQALVYLLGAFEKFLKSKDGLVAIVVIDSIVDKVSKTLLSDKKINIVFQKKWPGYTVFHYRFFEKKAKVLGQPDNSFEDGVFDRQKIKFMVGSVETNLTTTYGLSEFDTLQYDTSLMINELLGLQGANFKRALIFNPGQGYLPVTLDKIAKIKEITLMDRNLQSLRTSERNLRLNGLDESKIRVTHGSDLLANTDLKYDLVLGILEEKNPQDFNSLLFEQSILKLNVGGILILGSGSTPITRIEKLSKKYKDIYVVKREKRKGSSVIIINKK